MQAQPPANDGAGQNNTHNNDNRTNKITHTYIT